MLMSRDKNCRETFFSPLSLNYPHRRDTIRTSWSLDYTSPFYFRELISVIITPPITPWGFNKRNSQEKIAPCVVPLRKEHTTDYAKILSENYLA